MPSRDFAPVRFGDLLSEPLRNGVYKPKEHHGRGVKIVNMGELFGHPRLEDVPMKRLVLTESELRKSEIQPGDLLFARRSLVAEGAGKCSIVKKVNEPTTFESSIIRARPDPRQVDSDYLYYYFSSQQGRELMRTILRQVAVSGITGRDLAELRVPIPSIEVQRRCARTLEVMDDRIDLLRQTSATLEAIAQALFKSWFIDFDPVRAKAEGREPEGMDAVTAALFPAEFEDSTIGPIPKGWSVGTLAEHVLAERGLSYKGAGLCDVGEGLPMHNLNSVLEGGGYKYAGIKHYSGDYKERHIATAGDIIVTNTEQGHEHRLIGFPAIVPEKYDRAIYSHHLYRARIKADSPLTPHTLYYMLMAPSVREQIIGCANGSTVNMLKIVGLEIPRFACPTAPVSSAFEDLARPLRRQIEANVDRSEVLAALRDTLLPRLISGRLRLPEAEAAIEAAA